MTFLEILEHKISKNSKIYLGVECSKNDEIAPKARENFGNFVIILGNFDAFPWKFLFGNSEIVLEIIFGNTENEKKICRWSEFVVKIHLRKLMNCQRSSL